MERFRDKSETSALALFERLLKAAPFDIKIAMTDSGKQLPDHFYATRERNATNQDFHELRATVARRAARALWNLRETGAVRCSVRT
jgi:hypothetical protein